MKKKLIYIGSAVAIVLIALVVLKANRTSKSSFVIDTAKLGEGNICNIVTATGTLEAITTVEVGTQVSGVIEKLYVDFNSQVTKGQLLAKLDETTLRAQADQSQASVDNAKAELEYQKSTYERTKALFEKNLISQSDYDLAIYNYKKAQATLKNAQSELDRANRNLSYATIYSPIDGIVLERAVDEGQTVAASFSTPELFTIAKDLTQMQVEANVDEADIGQVELGQRVEFTVDAYPDMKFDGVVSQIRLQPVESSNVITYTVIINAPNPDKKLMPGMTANISIFVSEENDVLVIPGKALRFSPDQELVWSYLESVKENQPEAQLPTTGATIESKPGNYVWVKKGASISRKPVEVGDTDGINYVLLSGVNEGDELVLSLEKKSGSAATSEQKAASSPFMPKRPGQKK